MAEIFTNNAASTLAAGLTAVATSVQLAGGTGALFPDTSGGDTFHITVFNKSNGNHEIMLCTSRTTDTLTVTRAQQGTSAITFSIGDIVENRPTAAYLNSMASASAIQDNTHVYAADVGAADAYAITLSTAPTAYTEGQEFTFKATNANTGASTINVNGLGVKTIKKYNDIDLNAGDIEAMGIYKVVYDGTNFQMMSPISDTVNLESSNIFTGATQTIQNNSAAFNINSPAIGSPIIRLQNNGANRSQFYWDRGSDSLRIRQLDTDGSTVRSAIYLNETGEITFNTHSLTRFLSTGVAHDTTPGDGTYGLYIQPDSTGTVNIDAYSSGGSADLSFGVNSGGGPVTPALTINSSGHATFAGNISQGDGDYHYFGASNDLQIYHDGVNSALTNQTGTFYINNEQVSGNIEIRADDSTGTLHTCAIFGGSTPYVRLYYDNTVTLQTIAEGIRVYPQAGGNAFVIADASSGYGALQAIGSGTNNGYVFLNNDTTGELARIAADNSKNLYLSTDGGVNNIILDSTGNSSFPGFVTCRTVLNLTRSDDGATGPLFYIDHDSASPAAGDTSWISYRARDSATNLDEYARIGFYSENVTTTTEAGRILFQTAQSGTLSTRFNISGGFYHEGVTGGDKGDGSINVENVYDDGTLLVNGWELLYATTASSSSEITFTDLNATYDHYMITWDRTVPASGSATLRFQISEDNGSTWLNSGSAYKQGALNAQASTSQDYIEVTLAMSTSTDRGAQGHIIFNNVHGTGTRPRWIFDGTYCNASILPFHYGQHGEFNDGGGTDMDAVRAYMSSGNIASGNFAIYGLNKSQGV